MHHARKPKHRKMLKPKFCSSSSDDDDDIVDAGPMKWKAINASFPFESKKSRLGIPIETNPIIHGLNAQISNQQKQLSAEVIQKEEIYNQAETEANKRMFGCVNPGRCLSKDEIKRRKDIILQIVNERLKSKLSELMGEFDERIKVNDKYASGTSSADRHDRFRNRSPDDNDDDDDSLPEAPPPPTFNTTSESSEDDGNNDLDVSFTKEFELYEKEIKEKSSSKAQSNALSNVILTANDSTLTSMSRLNSQARTSTNIQRNWQQSTIQQWPMSDQSVDVTPWIPPVGPPQVMDPFPPPIESEQMTFLAPPPQFATFPIANRTADNGLMNPPWIGPSTNPPTVTVASNFGSVTPFSAPFRPSVQQPQMQSFNASQSVARMNWNPSDPRLSFNQTETTVRPNMSIVSKSPHVNAISAAEQKVTSSTGDYETNINRAGNGPGNGNWNKFNRKMGNDSHPRKRSYEEKNGRFEGGNNSNRTTNADRNSNEFNERVDDFQEKRSRFDDQKHERKQLNRFNSRKFHAPEPMQGEEPFCVKPKQQQQQSSEFDNRHVKRNAKFWNTDNSNRNSDSSNDVQNSTKAQTSVPMEWTKLCDIVDQLLDITPNELKDLPISDRRVKERNEVLLILSDDPRNFYSVRSYDLYGEQNVRFAVKMAQRVIFGQGRHREIRLALAPFREAIRISDGIDTSDVSDSDSIPEEWKRLCEIVDNLLQIPTRVIEKLPSTDSRVKERNEILRILSNDPEDFLLHDEKYGARNVDGAILAAKEILCPYGEPDERVQRIMSRQRKMLSKGFPSTTFSVGRPISRDREPLRKQSRHSDTVDESRARSVPTEWNQLCEIVDKVLDTPIDVRVRMSKKDPRWAQRDEMLLILSDDPDRLESQTEQLGRDNVEWAIKSTKKIVFPNGTKDRAVVKKLYAQRKLILRNRPIGSSNVEKSEKEVVAAANGVHKQRNNERVPKSTRDDEAHAKMKVETVTSKVEISVRDPEKSRNDQVAESTSEKESVVPVKEMDEKEVWSKLCNIVDKLLDLPANVADKLETSDKRLLERNDILMILSDDPENFSKFEANYGAANVTWAIKSAKKLIYSNGQPNGKLADALWKRRDAIMSAEEGIKEDTNEASGSNEWKCVRKIATKVFLQSCKSINNDKNTKLSKEQLHQQVELLLKLSNDPDVLRSEPICKKIGEGRVETAIAKCKHILNRMRTMDAKALLNFENLRSKMVLYSESLNQSKNIKNYDIILAEVRKIVDQKLFNEIYGQSFNKWTNEQKLERNELAILLIKDPNLLKSNEKYLEMVRKAGKATVTEIVDEMEKCLQKCEYVKEAPAAVAIPIIAKIKDGVCMAPYKEKRLIQRIHRLIEQFLIEPKPEVFEVRSGADGNVDVVCANAMTFDWLQKSIEELNGLWRNAQLSICEAPRMQKALDIDDLKEIKMMLKCVSVEPFAVVMKQLKKANSKLKTNKWQLVPYSYSDPKKMYVMVDVESLVELERSKREIIVESGTIYFDIQYVGKENF